MKKLVFILVLLGSLTVSLISSAQKTKKFIDPANMDLSVKPGDNFYLYANGTWIKNTPVPASKTRWGSFDKLAEESSEALKGLLDFHLKEGTDVEVLYFQDNPVALNLPVKVELKVTSAPPGVKGNSAGNVTKTVELETGVQVNVPMFINEGDMIRINTDTGEYVERA